jgi:hypothetical protein
MLSKEFLREAPQINPATGEAYTTAERDAEYAKTQAQGAKNLQGIKDFGNKVGQGVKNFFGYGDKAPAPAAPASNPEAELDPAIMRARYDQEAAARKAAPADAAPPPPGGAVAPVPSPTITATELPPPIKSFAEPAATGTAPAPMKGGYGSGVNNPSVAPTAGAAPATDAAAAAAADNASRSTVTAKDSGDKGTTPLSSEAERMQQLAGITPQPRERVDRTADIEAASKPAFAGQTDEFGGMESPAAAQSANDGNAGEDLAKIKANAGLAQSANDGDAGEAQAAAAAAPEAPAAKAFAEPEAPAAPAAPAAPVDTDTRRPGQLNPADAGKYKGVPPPATRTAAKSDPTVKALQDKLIAAGAKIKSDGVMGPATQAAMKQFPQASAPAAATRSAASGTVASAGGGRGFVNPTAANTTAAVAAAKPPAAPAKKATAESREINRMRFLAGLSKD